MAKKNMTKAQAAAARRPDDWEAPQPAPKKVKSKPIAKVDPASVKNQVNNSANKKLIVFFCILFVVMGVSAPFLVVFFSQLFGIS